MKVKFKVTGRLISAVMTDLARPHAFAFERVGFLSCRFGTLPARGLVVLASDYHAVADADYLDDARYGALMGPAALRMALQHTYNNPVGMFHVHFHDHGGTPAFSGIDMRETAKFVPDFFHARATLPHGALILSQDSMCGLCWLPRRAKPADISDFVVVDAPMRIIGHGDD